MDNIAEQVVAYLARGDFAAVKQQLADRIKPLASADMIRATWQGFEQQVGAFREQGKSRAVPTQNGLMQIVTCLFERGSLDVNVALSGAGEVVGLTITPVGYVEQQAKATYEPPSYAYPGRFHEQEVRIGHGRWVLPGTLSIPEGGGPFAAVLLVHGSGPQDRDETIPPNKPFRDLAWGLASQGVAVLRYDKRTKVYGGRPGLAMDTFTVREEVVDDALEGVAFLRGQPGIDPRQVFVLGHSLGGYLLPRIGAADPEICGLIVLAGSARPLEDVILDQMAYVLSLSVPDPEARRRQLASLEKQVELVKDPDRLPDAAATDLPLNIPAAYWLDLNAYRPEKVAQTLEQPMLFLQGGSDYQVTADDFRIWQDALGGRSDVEFTMYPGLGHLFMPVEGGGKATPAAYAAAGHVTGEVVDRIGNWIRSSPPHK